LPASRGFALDQQREVVEFHPAPAQEIRGPLQRAMTREQDERATGGGLDQRDRQIDHRLRVRRRGRVWQARW
jgi:hypothetical protein